MMTSASKGRRKRSGNILVFEDRPDRFRDFRAGLKDASTEARPNIELFEPPKGGPVTTEYLEAILGGKRSPDLVVLDKELSKYSGYVSSADVKEVCTRHGIPLCVYARASDEYKVRETQAWTEKQVSLDSRPGMERLALRCAQVYSGFVRIRSAFQKGVRSKKNLGSILTDLLNAPPMVSTQVTQYAWGYLGVLAKAATKDGASLAYVSTSIGYWIFNVLLRFPGVLLNEVAAASHLGIDPDQFRATPKIQSPFKGARYTGPFEDVASFWWTSKLDDILAGESDKVGKTLTAASILSRRGLGAIKPAKCAEGGHVGAGYYCILTDVPVCLEHSEAPRGWLPLGADKSRIRKSKYDELSPWFGF